MSKLQVQDNTAAAGDTAVRWRQAGELSQHDFNRSSDAEVRFSDRHGTTRTDSSSEHDYDLDDANGAFPKLERPRTRTLGKLKMRSEDDHDPTDWWFASTAIPLVAATFAPMANLLSIAALVVTWRDEIVNFDDPAMKYIGTTQVLDPLWCYDLNALSLACGFMGNLFLLFNFTQRVRYIIALPVTIFFFYLASGILIGIVVGMHQYTPATATEVYSQGYWHAVIAACLYLLNSMILMVNMAGYFLGHYPQHFTLTDEQRNLILQTMLFFLWLGGGAGVFARIQKWSYPDALYFCDVTILTIGFGDFYATADLGRGLVFPFSVGGTIILGLMVNSIHKFARELSKEKVVRKHVEHRRVDTLSRAITLDELDDRSLGLLAEGKTPNISSPMQKDKENVQQRLDQLAQQEREKRKAISFQDDGKDRTPAMTFSPDAGSQDENRSTTNISSRKEKKHGLIRAMTYPLTMTVSRTTQGLKRVTTKSTKKILMIEERDRFNAMRRVQTNASRFNRYYALSMSIIAFGMLWCLGAMVFYFAEHETQQLNYFEGLYFCYVSLLTIGYGDLSPKSNSGKAFFVVWSLIAVPTMTILVSDLGDTVIGGFKRGVLENDLGLTSSSNADGRTAKLLKGISKATAQLPGVRRKASEPVQTPLEDDEKNVGSSKTSDEDDDKSHSPNTIDELVEQDLSEAEMMKNLAFAIRRTADDLRHEPGKKYKYEDWVEFTRLIRFSKAYASGAADAKDQVEYDEANDGIVDWDWLDDKSPMTSEQSESEWVLDRLCESLLRIFKRSDSIATLLTRSQSRAVVAGHGVLLDRATSTGKRVVDEQSPAATDSNLPGDISPTEPSKPKNSMIRFLQGEQGNGGLKWSKRAQAKNAKKTVWQSDVQRRRSSSSAKHGRSGPFASPHKGVGRPSSRAGRKSSETPNKGLGITQHDE